MVQDTMEQIQYLNSCICSSTIGNKSETAPESGGENFNTYCTNSCIILKV